MKFRCFIPVLINLLFLTAPLRAATDRPNILWITNEDSGPHLGCYGDKFAETPHLDKLAAKSLRYARVWSVAPVCAPARTALISGMYPSSTGSEHMRSEVKMAAGHKMYPQLLREAGYYCTNNDKEDYNLTKPGKVWDDSSKKAHYKNRAADQPFFAVFNLSQTHESQCRKPGHVFKHQPADVPVPGFHPDCPEVRQSWAQYYDQMTLMDAAAGELLAELDAAGLAENTIVFYYSDHGPGLARCKRTPCHSGLHVPLLIHFPDKWKSLAPQDYQAGGVTERLVSFVDFAPTLLSIIGVEPPKYFQGRAFAGKFSQAPREFNFGLRGRMDERYDLARSVTDGRFVYVRNYFLHKPWGQHTSYMFETPMTVAWQKLSLEGKLPKHLNYFWQSPKAPEELYDLQHDRFETKNLAADPAHAATLEKMRTAHRNHVREIRDVAFLPEAEMLARAGEKSPYELGQDAKTYDFERIFAAAEAAADATPESLPKLAEGLADQDSGVRYWSVLGLTMRGKSAVEAHRAALEKLLKDTSPDVQVAAAEALAKHGPEEAVPQALALLVEKADISSQPYFAAIAAWIVLDELDQKAAPVLEKLRQLPTKPKQGGRAGDYVQRLKEKLLEDLR